MHEFTDSLNLIGISFEVIGFVTILPQLKRALTKRIHKLAEKADRENYGASIGIDESHEVVTNTVNTYWKKLENIGIPLVIMGLFFQGFSTLLHN